MKRPYIICHMLSALNGKITGNYTDSPALVKPLQIFKDMGNNLDSQALLFGRATTAKHITSNRKPDLDENAPLVPEGDYIAANNADKYFVSIDTSGRIGWETNTIKYQDRDAHVIEVLTDKTSNAYRAYLRKLGISYLIAGETELNCQLAVEKLYNFFNIKTLVLGGGGIINWSFLQAGLVDELSLILAPLTDGEFKTPSLFERAKSSPESKAVSFTLEDVKKLPGSTIYLRYKVENK